VGYFIFLHHYGLIILNLFRFMAEKLRVCFYCLVLQNYLRTI